MLKIYERRNALEIIISSESSLIKSVVRVSREFFADIYPERMADLEIVLRELILNAIRHGNRERSDKLIKIKIVPGSSSILQISVQDQGQGFDFRAVDLNLPSTGITSSNRGLKLVNALSNSLGYDIEERRITALLGNKNDNLFGLVNLFRKVCNAA